MPTKLLLALFLFANSTYSLAAETNTDAPINPIAQSEKTNQDSPNDVVSITPPLTLEQMLVKLKEAKGRMVKMDKSGKILTDDPATWDCLHQKSSGLTWEIKSNSGLRDKTNTYTWTEAIAQQGELTAWYKNIQGKCTGNARCETSAYIEKINQLKLCNFSDWRLPTKAELKSLVTMNRAKGEAKIDAMYFPNTLASWYWTADTNENHPDFAWYVLFKNGISLSDKKDNPKHLRLVRGTL